MTQRHEPPPPYAGLLEVVQQELDPIVAEIVRDVAGPGDDLEALTALRPLLPDGVVLAGEEGFEPSIS